MASVTGLHAPSLLLGGTGESFSCEGQDSIHKGERSRHKFAVRCSITVALGVAAGMIGFLALEPLTAKAAKHHMADQSSHDLGHGLGKALAKAFAGPGMRGLSLPRARPAPVHPQMRASQPYRSERASRAKPAVMTQTLESPETSIRRVRAYQRLIKIKANSYANTLGFGGATEEPVDLSEFPAPLTPSQRIVRAVTFYRKVLPVLFRYKFTELKLEADRELLGKDITKQEEAELWGEIDEWGSDRIYQTIADMKGFYVKTGQVISSRVDLFSEPYTSKLTKLQDGIDPMPTDLVRAVVEKELLGGQPLSELFSSFDEEPLGAASIAQVHKATLLDGRTVAVKVQRPNVEAKLRGDIANLKRISKQLRDQLPVDYYTVFSELGRVLDDELNFFHEAQAMRKIAAAVSHSVDGQLSDPPVAVPLPIGDFVSRRVVVMDFIPGTPLNNLQERLKASNIDPDSPEAKLAGQRILDALSEAFERMIFGAGFIHGDPHPGNIFVQEGAKVALIDCGQTKTLTRKQKLRLASTIVQVADYQRLRRNPSASEADLKAATRELASRVKEFGVTLAEIEQGKDPDELAVAVALILFGDKDMELPGGYSSDELADNSPVKLIASFPQELVLLGRATILLKGISAKLNVPFSLAETWAPGCRQVLAMAKAPVMPLWGKKKAILATADAEDEGRSRMRDFIRPWASGKLKSAGSKMYKRLPDGFKSRLTTMGAQAELRRREQKKK